uniref:protein-tyrosine-phosphatase n=1 Tax=Alexandrium monilatum TaxID=311494 RepID=A0A7S4VE01_9DINO
MTQAPPFQEEAGTIARLSLQAQLTELILRNGQRREKERYDRLAERSQQEEDSTEPFAADLVLREEDGFELWIGSLEDALSLRGLSEQGVNAFLNCAREECERECAAYRVCRGRSRCHARGPSATHAAFLAAATEDAGSDAEEEKALSREQVCALAIFDGDWYASMLGYDTAYLGLDGLDEPEYPMASHFPEAVAFLERCRVERRKVLVHCIMGVNRSAAVIVAFLCRGLGMSLGEAVALVSGHRGRVLSNGSFLDQLVDLYGQEEDSYGSEAGSTATHRKCRLAADLPMELVVQR